VGTDAVNYNSKLWKSIPSIDRGQLLLVIEGKKKSVLISASKELSLFLKKTDLNYIPERVWLYGRNQKVGNSIIVSKDKIPKGVLSFNPKLSQKERSKRRFTNAELGEIEYKSGKILGYPECCIKEFAKLKYVKNFPDVKLRPPFAKKIEKTKNIPEYLYYRVPSFTPCNLNCKKAKKLLISWMKTLKKNDKEAANAFYTFNKKMYKNIKSNKKLTT
jgi:hypothetical protein